MMGNIPYSVFSYFKQGRDVLTDVFAISSAGVVFHSGPGPERAHAHLVSGSFFPALGVSPLLGRTIGPGDERKQVVVLSHAFWSRRFGQDRFVVGRTVRVDDEPLTVIGVMPPAFFGVDRSRVPDLWLLLPAATRSSSEVWVLGHLKSNVSISQAHAVLEPLFTHALESLSGDIDSWTERDRKRFLSQKLLIQPASSGTSAVDVLAG